MKKIIIAIDGHASCGKSTLAKDLARKLKYRYIDTGAMYRAVTLFALQNNIIINNEINKNKLFDFIEKIKIDFKYNLELDKSETFLNNINVENKIRGMEVSNLVSPISIIGFVREKLVLLQQEMGKNKAIVMDGRDIGTVVFPDAELKIFLTAGVEVRAKRRFDELTKKGDNVNFDEILLNLTTRDKIDSTRKIAPLKKAENAILIDNSNIGIKQQFEKVLELCKEKKKN